ncbi:MAG: peptidase M4 [Hyphomicrobium sp.]|nr:peptidase M4 [Hyphomicrobium sp.]
MNSSLPPLAVLLIACALAVTGAAVADDDDDAHDHELARQALVEGRIRPLAEITEAFKSQMVGEIVGVELDTDAPGVFIYEFKILTSDGKLKEVDVDARTSKIIKIEDE